MRIKTKNSGLIVGIGFIVFTALAGPLSAHVISEEDHHAFEHKFAEMCVERENSAMKGSGVLLGEVTEMCDCIAKEESKRITIEEVRKFVREGKYPASLMMKSNAATYTCVQQKNQ
jgi:hypothetical protein